MKKGFTVAEMLVTLTIIGVIAVLTIPVVSQSMSAQYKQLYKTAFQNVESIVSELINDTALYPNGIFTEAESFCKNFSKKVNTIGNITCEENPELPGKPSFMTTNGMKWYLVNVTTNDFTSANAETCPDTGVKECLLIYVDVNGGKGKNTHEGADAQRDILRIYVSQSGKVYVPNDSNLAADGEGPERCYMTSDSDCPY